MMSPQLANHHKHFYKLCPKLDDLVMLISRPWLVGTPNAPLSAAFYVIAAQVYYETPISETARYLDNLAFELGNFVFLADTFASE